MEKERFLTELKYGGGVIGVRANMVWDAAINTDEKDPRWACVEEHDLINTFAKAFGLTLPEITRRPRRTQVERWTLSIEKEKERRSTNKDPEKDWIFAERIAELEKKLAYAKKHNI